MWWRTSMPWKRPDWWKSSGGDGPEDQLNSRFSQLRPGFIGPEAVKGLSIGSVFLRPKGVKRLSIRSRLQGLRVGVIRTCHGHGTHRSMHRFGWFRTVGSLGFRSHSLPIKPRFPRGSLVSPTGLPPKSIVDPAQTFPPNSAEWNLNFGRESRPFPQWLGSCQR